MSAAVSPAARSKARSPSPCPDLLPGPFRSRLAPFWSAGACSRFGLGGGLPPLLTKTVASHRTPKGKRDGPGPTARRQAGCGGLLEKIPEFLLDRQNDRKRQTYLHQGIDN